MSKHNIDLNCDMGEGFDDADIAMLDIVSSANIATGTHAGSKERFAELAAHAAAKSIAVGIHPGFNDPENFGRKRLALSAADITKLVSTEIAACLRLSSAPNYVKAHGALANMAEEDSTIAAAIAAAVRNADAPLALMGMAGLGQCRAAADHGITFIGEVFADRAYTPTGFLVPRQQDGAILHDPAVIIANMLDMVSAGAVITPDGTALPATIDSICVHGDTPGAVTIAAQLRHALEKAGYQIMAKRAP